MMSSIARLTRRFCSMVSAPSATVLMELPTFIAEYRQQQRECEERNLRSHTMLMNIFHEPWMKMNNSDHHWLNITMSKDLEAAENYFNSLDPCSKNQETYEMLLNCYSNDLKEDKAKAHLYKMDELQLLTSSSPFNAMMDMYLRLGQPDKVSLLVVAMKQREIFPCHKTYSLWAQSCASLNDLDGVENLFDDMNAEVEDRSSFYTFVNVVAVFTKAGLYSKAESALRLMERRIKFMVKEPKEVCKADCYCFLISSYAQLSNVTDVHRVWDLLKSCKRSSASYVVMLQALSRLHDIDGINKIFTEWESRYPRSKEGSHMSVADVVITNYLKENKYKEAVAYLNDAALKKRQKLSLSDTWELLMVHLLDNDQADLAFKQLEEVVFAKVKNPSLTKKQKLRSEQWAKVLANQIVWSSKLIYSFFLHFEKAKDVDGFEEFCRNLAKCSSWPLSSKTYTHLMKIYVAAGKLCPDMRKRLERRGIKVNEEQEDLLTKICP